MLKSKQARYGAAAVIAVALVAAGAAFAAGRMHGSTSSSARAGFGPPGAAGYGRGLFPGGRPNGFRGARTDLLATAATYLGIGEDTLMSSLRSGKTLAQIANATNGKSAGGLIDALVSAQKAQLAQAVKDGRLTQSQADQLSGFLTTRATAMVNGTGFGFRGRGGFGFGPPGGGPIPPNNI